MSSRPAWVYRAGFRASFKTIPRNPTLKKKRKKVIPDVGFSSVCYEYVLWPLVNKEATFGQWLNRI